MLDNCYNFNYSLEKWNIKLQSEENKEYILYEIGN